MVQIDSITHILHLLLGFGAAGAAIIALSAAKGSRLHRQAGWVFVAGMIVAAITAWIFMIARPLPLAMVSATVAIYALGTALFAINPKWTGAQTGEKALLALLILVMTGIGLVGTRFLLAGSPFAISALAFFAILAYFAVLDVRYLRIDHVAQVDRVRRHALRMGLAVSETVRAPSITFADELGLPVPVIVFGSFLRVPLIFFIWAPKVRTKAAKVAA